MLKERQSGSHFGCRFFVYIPSGRKPLCLSMGMNAALPF
jgi:hypothetical protein